jgi:hypothetical protein
VLSTSPALRHERFTGANATTMGGLTGARNRIGSANNSLKKESAGESIG